MRKIKIIYEDADIIVIYKPAGLATQTAKVGQSDIVSDLKNYLAKQAAATGKAPGQPYLGIIHRLDQPVEGLLVFAKNKKAAASLSAQLLDRETGFLNKQYYAVVCGKPAGETGELVDYMYKNESGRAIVATGSGRMKNGTAKKAVLHYGLVATAKSPSGKEFSLLDISIDTGRFHQIRAQMSHAGMALLGDAKYGNEQSQALSQELGVRNVALCAYNLELLHPVTGAPLHFCIQPEAPIFSYFDGK